jgi:hypothetical protein
MRDRRFVLLAAVLVTLNVALWLAPQGLALQRVVVASLFGKNMVRFDVTDLQGCPTACVEWRGARGVVVSNKLGVLTLSEADTKVESINVSSSTKVTGLGTATKPVKINGVKPGWHVVVTWPAPNGTADSVVIEKRGKS